MNLLPYIALFLFLLKMDNYHWSGNFWLLFIVGSFFIQNLVSIYREIFKRDREKQRL